MKTKIERFSEAELKRVAEYLYDGVIEVYPLIQKIRQYKRGDRILLWLVANKIRGHRMIEYFQTESNSSSNRGVLLGVQTALTYMDNEKPELTIKDLI